MVLTIPSRPTKLILLEPIVLRVNADKIGNEVAGTNSKSPLVKSSGLPFVISEFVNVRLGEQNCHLLIQSSRSDLPTFLLPVPSIWCRLGRNIVVG